MAKKKTNETAALQPTNSSPAMSLSVQQPPAEERFAEQLAFLRAVDVAPRPPGWLLSPERVVDFLCGTRAEAVRAPASVDLPAGLPKSIVIDAKFVGSRSLVERCV